MHQPRWLDTAVLLAGPVSCFGLLGFFAALHDIYDDFASPELWARAGQPLPSWYSAVNRTPLEWDVLQFAFIVVAAFHVLLFARYAAATLAQPPELRKSPGPIGLVGIVSSLGLLASFLALHDIYQDYASPAVWARAGQPLPAWYLPGNQTLGEWRVLQAAFVITVVFHLLLLTRFAWRTVSPALRLLRAAPR